MGKKKRAKKTKVRAFQVRHKIKFPDGQTVARSDYFETDNPVLQDLLTRCKEDSAVEIPVSSGRRALAQEKAEAEASAATAAAQTVQLPEGVAGQEQPDWEFKTIPAMREWLDRAGVDLPPKRAHKATHEAACKGAWEAGRRPHPLYGFPGGPEPSPGMAGPKVTADALATAVGETRAMGLAVPGETLKVLEDLKAARAAPVAPQGVELPIEETPVPEGLEIPEEPEDLGIQEHAGEPSEGPAGDEQEAAPAAATAEGSPPQE